LVLNIPAGTFTMGSPVNESDRTGGETQHQVTLSAFKMSKYEITFYLGDAFCGCSSGLHQPGLPYYRISVYFINPN